MRPGAAAGWLFRLGGAVCLAAALCLPAASLAGQREITREDLVGLMERGPGPAKGSAKARVALVEFSDFQCYYCAKFAQETLPKLEERYIRPGAVRFIYRHVVLFGEASLMAAQASSCALAQGKFWEYHDQLFRHRSPLAFTAARLKDYAKGLKLAEGEFAACLDSGRFAEQVEAETMIGRALGANGTPTFLINGQLLIGAHPFDRFQGILDQLLAPKGPAR